MQALAGRSQARRVFTASIIAILALALAVPAASAAPKTKLASQSTGGAQSGSASSYPDIGADGGAVVFETFGNFLGTDYNLQNDIYRRRVGSKQTELVSRSKTGHLANGYSDRPVLSANGRYVVFMSTASNLTAADSKGYTQVYRRDLVTSRTNLVSKGADGAAEGAARLADVSATGRYVVFATSADNLTTKNTRGKQQIYLRDMKLKKTVLISQSSKGKASDQDCYYPAVSDDGRFVAFTSEAANLSPRDERGHRQVFLRDRKQKKTILVSKNGRGKAGDDTSLATTISGNGRYVVFTSQAANLIKWGKDSNGKRDIYRYDRVKKMMKRISVDRRGRQLGADSFQPDVSADGKVIVFTTAAANVVPGISTGHKLVYRRGGTAASIRFVSRTNGGLPANDDSSYPSVSADGRFVAYQSEATNLTRRPDANGSTMDVFRSGPF